MKLCLLPLLLFGANGHSSSRTSEVAENEIDIDSLDESDIFDVVQNFIAEKDPILEVHYNHHHHHHHPTLSESG